MQGPLNYNYHFPEASLTTLVRGVGINIQHITHLTLNESDLQSFFDDDMAMWDYGAGCEDVITRVERPEASDNDGVNARSTKKDLRMQERVWYARQLFVGVRTLTIHGVNLRRYILNRMGTERWRNFFSPLFPALIEIRTWDSMMGERWVKADDGLWGSATSGKVIGRRSDKSGGE